MKTPRIPKAYTFGEDNNWQVNPTFLKKLKKEIATEEMVYEELLDDLLVALIKLGYLKWEE